MELEICLSATQGKINLAFGDLKIAKKSFDAEGKSTNFEEEISSKRVCDEGFFLAGH